MREIAGEQFQLGHGSVFLLVLLVSLPDVIQLFDQVRTDQPVVLVTCLKPKPTLFALSTFMPLLLSRSRWKRLAQQGSEQCCALLFLKRFLKGKKFFLFIKDHLNYCILSTHIEIVFQIKIVIPIKI